MRFIRYIRDYMDYRVFRKRGCTKTGHLNFSLEVIRVMLVAAASGLSTWRVRITAGCGVARERSSLSLRKEQFRMNTVRSIWSRAEESINQVSIPKESRV